MQSTDRIADVLIVGGGIMGCATAYHLARAGGRVTVLEKNAVAYQASGRNLGAVRQQMRHPLELPIAMEAVRRWEHLDEELDAPTEYQTVGNLLVTWQEGELEPFRQEAARQRPLGLDVQVLQGKDLREVAPGLAEGIVGGMYSATDGQANPQKATLAFARAVRRAGARILTGVMANSLLVQNGRVQGVSTDQGDFSAGTVLVAAGVGTPPLVRPLGLEIRVDPWLHQPLVTTRAPRVTYPYVRVTGPRVGFGQTAEGTVIFGLGPPQDVGFVNSLAWDRISRAFNEMVRLVPTLRDIQVVRAYTGWFEVSPDDLPIMGPVEGIEGLIVAAGFSGHGFAMGPAIGKLLSELILEGKTSIPIDGFRPSRFKDAELKHEESSALSKLWALTAPGTNQ